MKTLCLILLSLSLVFAETVETAQAAETAETAETTQSAEAKSGEWTLDEGVVVLTTDNFQKALEEFKYTLVEFYAPWCGHCQRLAPEYAAAAQKLAETNPDIRLAKVEATENQELADKFDVQGFPTIKFFKQGESEPVDYNGGRTTPEIISWLSRRTGSVSTEVNTVEAVDEYVKSAEALALFIGTSTSSGYEAFVKAVTDLDQVVVLNSNDEKVIEKYGGKENNLIVFNGKGDEKHVYEGEATADAFQKFINENEFPAVSDFNQATVQRVFQGGLDAIILLKAKNEAGEKAEAIFREVGKELKSEIIFTIANNDEDLGGRVAEFLGVAETELPTLRIVQPANNMLKYKPEGELNQENIKKFVQDLKAGNLKPFFKSADVPAEPFDGNVRVVVAKTWEEIVMDSTKDVLIEFYAPWCGHCQNLAPIYEALAANNKNIENLVVAKMDATANEVQGVDIQGFPTIRLYKKDDKQNPVEYEGEREEKKMVRFLKKFDVIPKDGTEEPSDVDQAYDFGEAGVFDAGHDDHAHHDHDHDDHDHDHAHDQHDEKKPVDDDL